jgi:hypothetical protein
MHRYYTPKPIEFQAVLAIFTIFVNYADFYVNIIMLTDVTTASIGLAKIYDFPTSWADAQMFHTRCWFCKISCKITKKGK